MNETAIITIEPEIRLGVLAIRTPQDMVTRASEIATALAHVVDDKKLYTMIQGRKYVRVEGWSTLGSMLGVIPREVSVTENEKGDFVATVELVRVNDGAIVGRGSSLVGSDEKTWSTRSRYARYSMALTRATGKAYRLCFSWIMNLAGYEPTPAEEMVDAEIIKVESPKPTTEHKTNKWNDDIISWAVDKWPAIKTYQVVGALNQSKVLTPDMPSAVITHWLEIRKGARDTGEQSEVASEFADADYIATHEQAQSA